MVVTKRRKPVQRWGEEGQMEVLPMLASIVT